MPEDILRRLASFMLSTDNTIADDVGWGLETNGVFSVASAYDAIAPSLLLGDFNDWLNIWRLKVANRICMFL